MYDCSAAAILQPGCVFETIEEAERVFDEALGDDDAEEVALCEIDEDGNKRIVKRETLGR